MSKNLFITGTGTDVGKTYVTGLIVKKLWENGIKAAYYKAAMSGNERRPDGSLIPGDALHVKTVSGSSQPLEEMCPYIYETAVSPHLAARLEGNPIEMERVLAGFDALAGKYQYVTAEGSGGILCPLRFDEQEGADGQNPGSRRPAGLKAGGQMIWLEDFVRARNLNCLMVADAGLGTINAVVLTAAYMKSRGLTLKGIIFNNYEAGNVLHEDNRFMCEEMTGLKALACVGAGDRDIDISLETLTGLYQ